MATTRAAEATCTVCELHAEAVFRVEGMDCNEEVVILERRLKPLAGMEAIAADVMGQRLHVKYDAAKLTTAAMVDAVGQTGMRMWLEHEEPHPSGSDARSRLILMSVSGAALAGGFVAAALGAVPVSITFYVAAALTGAIHPARRAIFALRSRNVDINVLMVVAVAGALALGDWPEAASVVFLFAVAQWLEVRTLERARQAIRALLDLAPRDAIVRREGIEVRVPVDEIRHGDHVIVRPGEKVAVDGVILDGRSAVNEAPVTGESLPVDKDEGDEVFAGTINGHGALELRVTRVGGDTRLAQVIHLVEVAQAKRAPVQTFVDRFARVYTPVVIALAVLIALLPPLVGAGDSGEWLYRALVLLVIACPCALVISTPVSVVSALSAAARHGVLIKGGTHLERLAAATTVAFDKTGTLTTGHVSVGRVTTTGTLTGPQLIRLAAAVESRSEHPVGRAIARQALEFGLALPDVSAFAALPGRGAEAVVEGRTVLVGNMRLMEERSVRGLTTWTADSSQPRSTVFVAVDADVVGEIEVEDAVRPTARDAVDLLRAQGIERVVMLTGDRAETAATIAAPLGLDATYAGLLPDQKHAVVESLRGTEGTGGAVVMVGDGINDAPALAAADVGIAMGAAGSDIALETADSALMSDELLKLPYAVRLARATLRNVKTNVAISLALKGAFLILAMLGVATLWMAVLADTGASVIVVANALRLLRSR